MKKTILILFLTVLSMANISALIIHNQNNYNIDIEIMDVDSYKMYDYPSSWETCGNSLGVTSNGQVFVSYNCYKDFDKYRSEVDFILTKRNFNVGSTVLIEQSKYPTLPEQISIKLSGYTGTVELHSLSSSCEITVKNKGFLRGIIAEISNCI